ncbi:UPF0160 protein myg1, mitochondrial, partial [Xenotaenia resolanae]
MVFEDNSVTRKAVQIITPSPLCFTAVFTCSVWFSPNIALSIFAKQLPFFFFFVGPNGISIFFSFRTFAENFHSLCPEKPWVTKLSSAGLVYLHFGRRLLALLTQMKEDDRQLEVLFDKLYENFVEEVDAVDNGISQYDGEARYAVSSTLSARVAHLNPRWNSKSQDTEEGFRKALKMVGEEFLDRLDFYKSSWLPARAVVEQAVKERHK